MNSDSAGNCLVALNESQAFGGQPPRWAEAMAARPAGALPFLDKATLSARRRAAGLSDDADAPLRAAADAIAVPPMPVK